MKETILDKNLLPAEPMFVSWGGKTGAGSWGLDFDFDFDPKSSTIQDINQWYFVCLKKSLDAFDNLARVWKVSITLADQSEIAGETIEWKYKKGEDYQNYVDSIIDKLLNYPSEIYEINISLDLCVFVYTQESPKKPTQNWVRDLANLIIAIEIEDEEPYLSLEMHHTLFYPFSYNGGEDNTTLFGLNQPLLKEALRNWEQNFDVEIDVEGLPGIYKYGYLPEDQW